MGDKELILMLQSKDGDIIVPAGSTVLRADDRIVLIHEDEV